MQIEHTKAILSNPSAEAPRAALAAWLAGRGFARAALLRRAGYLGITGDLVLRWFLGRYTAGLGVDRDHDNVAIGRVGEHVACSVCGQGAEVYLARWLCCQCADLEG